MAAPPENKTFSCDDETICSTYYWRYSIIKEPGQRHHGNTSIQENSFPGCPPLCKFAHVREPHVAGYEVFMYWIYQLFFPKTIKT